MIIGISSDKMLLVSLTWADVSEGHISVIHPLSFWFVARLSSRPKGLRQNVLPKCWLTSSGLHVVIQGAAS
jgi:hypothetical protein